MQTTAMTDFLFVTWLSCGNDGTTWADGESVTDRIGRRGGGSGATLGRAGAAEPEWR